MKTCEKRCNECPLVCEKRVVRNIENLATVEEIIYLCSLDNKDIETKSNNCERYDELFQVNYGRN